VAALSHRKHASAGTFLENCSAQEMAKETQCTTLSIGPIRSLVGLNNETKSITSGMMKIYFAQPQRQISRNPNFAFINGRRKKKYGGRRREK
jgi:hypothetical protein